MLSIVITIVVVDCGRETIKEKPMDALKVLFVKLAARLPWRRSCPVPERRSQQR
jgi:hypothetical protein